MTNVLTPAQLSPFASLHPKYDTEHSILWLNLDHGKANEMGSEQLEALDALAQFIEQQDCIRCLATSSERLSKKGKPIFIAGANVTERADWSPDKVEAHVHRQRVLMKRLREIPVFSIALTHGVTLGWGAEFLLAMDYAIATPQARIALPETGLGIIPGAGGTAHLTSRISPANAMLLGCTGESLSGEQAIAIGLVSELVADVEAGKRRVEEIARSLAKRSPTAVAAFKRAVLSGLGQDNDTREQLEAQAYQHCIDHGQAALGRANFAKIIAGEAPDWGPRKL